MDVYNPVFISGNGLFAQNAQIARQRNHLDATRAQHFQQLFIPADGIRLHHVRKHSGFHAARAGALQRIRRLAVGKHKSDFPVLQVRVEQSLQIRAAAGNEHRDLYSHSSMPPSPLTSSPST